MYNYVLKKCTCEYFVYVNNWLINNFGVSQKLIFIHMHKRCSCPSVVNVKMNFYFTLLSILGSKQNRIQHIHSLCSVNRVTIDNRYQFISLSNQYGIGNQHIHLGFYADFLLTDHLKLKQEIWTNMPPSGDEVTDSTYYMCLMEADSTYYIVWWRQIVRTTMCDGGRYHCSYHSTSQWSRPTQLTESASLT